jgi:hypothetical protein
MRPLTSVRRARCVPVVERLWGFEVADVPDARQHSQRRAGDRGMEVSGHRQWSLPPARPTRQPCRRRPEHRVGLAKWPVYHRHSRAAAPPRSVPSRRVRKPRVAHRLQPGPSDGQPTTPVLEQHPIIAGGRVRNPRLADASCSCVACHPLRALRPSSARQRLTLWSCGRST